MKLKIGRLFFAMILLEIISMRSQAQTSISETDFIPILGSWQGALTYLDYTSGKPFTMSANREISRIGKTNQFIFKNSYPNEPQANSADTILISSRENKIDDEKVIQRRNLEKGNLEIVTEVLGKDGNENKPALIRHSYLLGNDVFRIIKDVQFVGKTEWIKRNEYRYQRKG